jgi:uncharacterized protein (DUF2236 family)
MYPRETTSQRSEILEQRAEQSLAVSRRIWGNPETILLIFAGSAAEFAVNKAVDWLFWTNALPDAPIDRFFETVRFAQAIAFGDAEVVAAAIDGVNRAHQGVERSRKDKIPQWAYRDVLFMLIDYGERAHAIVYGPMSDADRLSHFHASLAIARAMHIQDLPQTYEAYQQQRASHLRENTARTAFTDLLYRRYRSHLGIARMQALLDLQASIVPPEVAALLQLRRKRRVDFLLRHYRRITRGNWLHRFYPLMLPRPYGGRLAGLERHN